MVPFGKHAFFEGELIHTNEFLVGLGCDLVLEASAMQAAGVLARRQSRAEAALASTRLKLEDMRSRAAELTATLSNEDGEDLVDIQQDFEESEALMASAQGTRTAPQPLQAAVVEVAPPRVVVSEPDVREDRCEAAGSRTSGETQKGEGDDDDERIFARLSELERLEAEAGSGYMKGESDEGDNGGGNCDAVEGMRDWKSHKEGGGEASVARGNAAVPVHGRDGLGVAMGIGAANEASVPAICWQAVGAQVATNSSSISAASTTSTTTSVDVENAARPAVKVKAKAGALLKKGFLLGGGGGRGGGGRAPLDATVRATSQMVPSSTALDTDLGSRPQARQQQKVGPSRSKGVSVGERRTCRESQAEGARRVSFADGLSLIQADDGDAGPSKTLHARAEGQRLQGSHAGTVGMRSALKQEVGNIDPSGSQVARAVARGGDGSLRGMAAQVVALADGGDAAMAMARAQEEAFNGLVRERVVDDVGEVALGPPRAGVVADESAVMSEDGLAASNRVSKFKQQRMGIA